MSLMVPEMEPALGPNPARRVPQRALRGLRRQQAVKALKALKTINRQDVREGRRAEAKDYTALLIAGVSGSLDSKALYRVIARLETVLAMKM